MSRDVLPPYQILQGGCLRQDSAILFDISQLDSAFFDMIGGMADLAFHSHTGELGTRTVMQDRRQTPTDTELLALAHLMYQEPRWVQIAESWATWEPEVLLPLVPYLIRVADPDTCRSIDPAETCRWARDVAREVLEDISGEWYGAPEQWWAWWEGQSGP